MKKKFLSLALALALCLGLAVPAFAAGTTETVVDEKHGVTITMDGFLRVETRRYPIANGPKSIPIYVVADNSTVSVKALEGRKYAETDADYDAFWEELNSFYEGVGDIGYAYCEIDGYMWDEEESCFYSYGEGPVPALDGPLTYTMAPSEGRNSIDMSFSISFLCESDYAKLVPFEGKPNASGWAQEALANAYDAGLFPDTINPYEENCSRGMTRSEFAAVAVNLYAAMQEKRVWELDVSAEHPFTDVQYDDHVAYAYNLGIVTGTSATTFSPNKTLTRQEAAVMLARVYTKLHGDIPAVTATSFADDGQIGGWARSGVAFMADKGIVNGVGDNSFAPKKTLSIQEAVIMAQRMLENLK